MRYQRLNQLNAEQESTADAATWSHVYRIMRCPDSCSKGPHCFCDSVTGRHYKMFPHHLEDLVGRRENGMKFESQDDVPRDIRQQLYAEEQQRRDTSQSKTAKSSAAMTPITLGPACPCQFPADCRHRHHLVKLVREVYNELIEVSIWPNSEIFEKSMAHGRRQRSTPPTRIAGCSSATEGVEV
jgi:hypothetical protein